MNQPPPPSNVSSRTRMLLRVNFVTFVVIAMAFVGIVIYSRGLHERIFSEIELVTGEIDFSSEVHRTLVKVNADIQRFINQVLRKPEVLNRDKVRLLKDFQALNQRVARSATAEADQNLLASLNKYYGGFEDLLRDFTKVKEVQDRLRTHQQMFVRKLNALGASTGQLVTAPENFGKMQGQALVGLCQENLSQIQALIDASVANNDSSRLGVGNGQLVSSPGNTVAGEALRLRQALQALVSREPILSGPAREILAALPAYLAEMSALQGALDVLNGDWRQFEVLRHATMQQQEKIFALRADKITELKQRVVGHDKRLLFFTMLFSALVLSVALAGLLLSRKLGAQLENMADEAIGAKELTETFNAQLQIEVGERRLAEEALRESGDQLDRRVRERTAQLAASNLMLQEEIDIRFKAEEALAAEKERLAVTLRSIDDGVISTDREGLVMMVNKVAEELTGWPQVEAVGRPLAEVLQLCDRRSRKPVADLLDLDRSDVRVAPRQNLLLARDGRERLVADSGSPIHDGENRVVGWAVVFRDISEQEKLGEELLKIRKLESVGVLAGGIAHDFNNILAAILGNINLVMMATDPGDRRYHLLTRAEKASLRAKDLTQQLLTFSKGGEPVKKVASIGGIIEDSAEFVLRGSKSKCRYLLPDDLWAVEVDAGQISQVVQNIALNASQAMPDGGNIEIACANFDNCSRLVPDMGDRLLRLTIADNGSGIAQEQVARIFDPYFTTKPEGSGLGLAITHSIIVKHGGHISVESQPGQGTIFTIYLVAANQACVAEPPIEAQVISGSGLILVLDDEEMVREVAREMLEHLGYEVLLAGDGREAIELHHHCCQKGRPIDLYLVDLTIPGGMGGREAVEELLALDPQVRAVVTTGYSNDPVVANFRDYGFVEMVGKPFRVEELSGVIAKVMKAEG